MYVKPPRKQFQGGMYVPDNYHGTAFTQEDPSQSPEQEQEQQTPEQQAQAQEQPQAPLPEAVPASQKQEGGLLSSLFAGFGGLRSDDILLLALILLLSRSDESRSSAGEILPLLAILLFMG